MIRDKKIEIAVGADATNNERGTILEQFVREFLQTQNFEIESEVRVTGSELDLYAVNKTTNEKVMVECKAQRSNVAAEVISKLYGNVIFNNLSAGWLITTHGLSKDAKGMMVTLKDKPESERRRLHIYPPDQLLDYLISARIVTDPENLSLPEGIARGHEAHLLLTPKGRFWALPVPDQTNGMTTAALLYNAENGSLINDAELLAWMSNTDASLATLPWLNRALDKTPKIAKELAEELQSIVNVPVADHWSDYRPSRPVDFVGREELQNKVFAFLDKVREQKTQTRLIAIKAPSGWGKSSILLKIADRAKNKRNKGKYFIYPVDSRAAISKRFPELALVSAIRASIIQGFVNGPVPEFGSPGNLLSTPSVAQFFAKLNAQQKVICLFFDQFEELLSKVELAEVFEEMRRLAISVEELGENLTIGFSWKTDGTVPTDHNAYHLWHGLSDRRHELEVQPFSDREVALAIGRFSKELGQPVSSQIRRMLQEQSQGFPWLLKKLSIHILNLVSAGAEQIDILNTNLNIGDLFKKDLELLSASETGCIKQIAAESPAEFFKIVQVFGDQIVNTLIQKRLVIRSGTKLTIYWDIFRDYILTEKIPYIPVTNIPQGNFGTLFKVLKYLLKKSSCLYKDLAAETGLSDGATDNMVRDLVYFGLAEADRKNTQVRALYKTEHEALQILFKFWLSHDVVRRLSAEVGYNTPFSEEFFAKLVTEIYERFAFSPKTLETYSRNILKWLVIIGLITENGNSLILHDHQLTEYVALSQIEIKARASDVFLAPAPFKSVLTAYAEARGSKFTRDELEAKCGRNAVSCLFGLNLVYTLDGTIIDLAAKESETETTVIAAAAKARTVQIALNLLSLNPSATGDNIGEAVASELNMSWATASIKRYGHAIRLWALRVSKESENQGFSYDLFCRK